MIDDSIRNRTYRDKFVLPLRVVYFKFNSIKLTNFKSYRHSTYKLEYTTPCLVEFIINEMNVFLYLSIKLRILTYTKGSSVTLPLIQHSMHLFHIPVSRVVVINSIGDVIPRSLSPSYSTREGNGTFTKSGRRRRCNPAVARARRVCCLRFAQYSPVSLFSSFLLVVSRAPIN